MHIDQQRAAGDDLGDPAHLLGACTGPGYPPARPGSRQGRTPALATMHKAKHGGTRHEAAGRHDGSLHDRRGATRHDLMTVAGRSVGRVLRQHRHRIDNL